MHPHPFLLKCFFFSLNFVFFPFFSVARGWDRWCDLVEYLHFSPVAIWTFLFNRGAHSVLGNAVTTLWMTCCINQCLKIMILKLFKLKIKKKDFGCLPWVGYLLESHAVELLKKVHMELSPLMFFFKKITCWIYHQYNGIYIFLSYFPFCSWLLVHTWFN